MDWQPIETAPRDGTPVLLAVAGGDYHPRSAWFDATIGKWVIADTPIVVLAMQPTHWKNMDNPPSKDHAK